MFPVINFLKGNSGFSNQQKWAIYAFGNTLTRAESDKVFDEIVVPESRNIPRQTLYKSFANVDLKNRMVRYYLLAEKKTISSAILTKRIATAYKDKNSDSRPQNICRKKPLHLYEQDGYMKLWTMLPIGLRNFNANQTVFIDTFSIEIWQHNFGRTEAQPQDNIALAKWRSFA